MQTDRRTDGWTDTTSSVYAYFGQEKKKRIKTHKHTPYVM